MSAAGEHLADARDDRVAFTAISREIWRQVWSFNPQERLNRDVAPRLPKILRYIYMSSGSPLLRHM